MGGASLDGLDFFAARRAWIMRQYNHYTQMFLQVVNGAGSVDDGAALGFKQPYILCKAATIAGPPATNTTSLAEATEYFNSDPFHDPTNSGTLTGTKGDNFWAVRQYARTTPAVLFNFDTTPQGAGQFIGLSIGGVNVLPEGISDATAQAIHLRYDYFNDHYFIVVVNKYASAGQRRTTIDLGTSATIGIITGAGPRWATSSPYTFEIDYNPGPEPFGYIDFLIDGILVKRFTDADGIAGTKPLNDFYNNRHAVGSTLKGMSIYTILPTFVSGNPQLSVGFFDTLAMSKSTPARR